MAFGYWQADEAFLEAFNHWCAVLMPYCIRCGKRFSASDRRRYCSSECSYQATLKEAREKYPDYVRGRFVIFNRDGFRCAYCGHSSFGNGAELHCDHIVPRSRGGANTAANLITACTRCNLEKHRSTLFNTDELLAEVAERNLGAGLSPESEIKL
jgi:5-methylcytosine-specific restriction endonuclease McrA